MKKSEYKKEIKSNPYNYREGSPPAFAPSAWVLKEWEEENMSEGIAKVKFWTGISDAYYGTAATIAIPFYGWFIAGPTCATILGVNNNQKWQTLCFDSTTEELLSKESVSEAMAVKSAKDAAQNYLKEGKCAEAAAKFQEALDKSTVQAVKDKLSNSKNAVDLAVEAQNLLNNSKFSEAISKFQEALKYSNTDEFHAFKNDAEARVRVKEGKGLLDQGKLSEAVSKFQEALTYSNTDEFHAFKNDAETCVRVKEAIQSWDEAWDAENNGLEEARALLEACKNSFKAAFDQMPDNTQYKQYFHMVSLKIEGNRLFNEGIVLQSEANELLNTGKYNEALNKYEESQRLFTEGIVYDQRFQVCIDIVNKSIASCNDAIELQNAQNEGSSFDCTSLPSLGDNVISDDQDITTIGQGGELYFHY